MAISMANDKKQNTSKDKREKARGKVKFAYESIDTRGGTIVLLSLHE